MKKQLKLITALGDNKNLILELLDFFNGGGRYHYREEANHVRTLFAGRRITELHLICTEGIHKIFAELEADLIHDYPDLIIHPLSLSCDDIICGSDDAAMRDTVYRKVRELSADDLVISSGGRKQVTQRLIEAGLLYGCMGYLSITAPQGKDRDPQVRTMTLEFNVLWTPARQFSEERRRRIIKDELGDNFRSLYLLPANVVQHLRNEHVGVDPERKAEELTWLRRLPKADLHCHLGGAFDAALLKELGVNLLDDLGINGQCRATIRGKLEQRVGKKLPDLCGHDLLRLRREKEGEPIVHPLQNLEVLFQDCHEPKHILTAVLVENFSGDRIEEISWSGPSGLRRKNRLQWYMACGDLGGSALLQTEKNLRRALCWLLEEARKENVFFLEVRFSPENYTRAGLTIPQVIEALLSEADVFMGMHAGFYVNFLIMATRHKKESAMKAHVAAAITFGQPGNGHGSRITGFDLAGQEEGNDPVRFQEAFMPLHHHFMNITIHAGEMEEDDKIWQAIYLLHARRIGHGLKLKNNEKMMGYIRDYGIAIEMCPSSNMQTNGFRYFCRAGDKGEVYPLKKYLDFGLTVTINTDNRGISRTSLTDEYLLAAQLTQGGLSKWEILRLAKNSFKAAFLPKDEKDRLLKEIDEKVFSLVIDDFFPECR